MTEGGDSNDIRSTYDEIDEEDEVFRSDYTEIDSGEWFRPMERDVGDASADMVDHVVDMAFGQNRGSNYVFRFEALEVYAIV
nr:patatin-like protein 6 [Tanacetum cinerariifolium]